nr:uncharacterized protein LOC121469901 isoform X2 [Taeniopygia guttata]
MKRNKAIMMRHSQQVLPVLQLVRMRTQSFLKCMDRKGEMLHRTARNRWMALVMEQELMMPLWLTQPLKNREQRRRTLKIQILFPPVHSKELLLGVQFAWSLTQSLFNADDSSWQPYVAMSSAVDASLLLLRLLTCAQTAEWHSHQNYTIPFIYEC